MILIKNKIQIEGIRKSCKLSANTLKHIEPFVQEGIATEELDQICHKYIKDNGGIPAPLGYCGYPKATCISLNEVICHGIPDGRKLKNGDILNIDVSTVLDGYFGDTGAMFTVGEISNDAKRILEVAKNCLMVGIEQVRPGNRFGNIGYEINKYALSQKCTTVYQFGGHGLGIQLHEDPSVMHIANKNSGSKMSPGMIFTIEPMINLGLPDALICEDGWTAVTSDGKLSAQYEHAVLVTKDGCEILTLAD